MGWSGGRPPSLEQRRPRRARRNPSLGEADEVARARVAGQPEEPAVGQEAGGPRDEGRVVAVDREGRAPRGGEGRRVEEDRVEAPSRPGRPRRGSADTSLASKRNGRRVGVEAAQPEVVAGPAEDARREVDASSPTRRPPARRRRRASRCRRTPFSTPGRPRSARGRGGAPRMSVKRPVLSPRSRCTSKGTPRSSTTSVAGGSSPTVSCLTRCWLAAPRLRTLTTTPRRPARSIAARREELAVRDEGAGVDVEDGPRGEHVHREAGQAVARAVDEPEGGALADEAERPAEDERALDAGGEERGPDRLERLVGPGHHAQALVLGVGEGEAERLAGRPHEAQRAAGLERLRDAARGRAGGRARRSRRTTRRPRGRTRPR